MFRRIIRTSTPNPVVALIPGDDRQWIDGIDAQAVYLNYHDEGTFIIEVHRSNDGGQTYVDRDSPQHRDGTARSSPIKVPVLVRKSLPKSSELA